MSSLEEPLEMTLSVNAYAVSYINAAYRSVTLTVQEFVKNKTNKKIQVLSAMMLDRTWRMSLRLHRAGRES